MTAFSCVVIGNESLLIGCSDALLDKGHRIRAVVSQDADIRNWASGKGLPVLDQISDLAQAGPFDWLFSIANLSLLPDDILALPARGALNFHDGPLPRRAGLNAPVWALIDGDDRFGITWHMLEPGIDTGDIVEQRMFDIAEGETAFSLNSKCYAAGLDSFGAVIAQLESGGLDRTSQDLSQRSYHGRNDRPRAAGRIDFTDHTTDILALVNALDTGPYWNPLTCPKIEIAGEVVLVSQAAHALGHGAPGSVIEGTGDSLTIATGDGAVRLSELRDAFGQSFDLSGKTQVGQALPSPDAGLAAALEDGLTRCLPGETRARAALQQMRPTTAPLTHDTGKTGTLARELLLPGTLGTGQIAAATLAWALRNAGEDITDIALTTDKMQHQTRPGYVTGWRPLQARRDQRFTDLTIALDSALSAALDDGGWPCDLVARDPNLAGFSQPAIALSLDYDAPLPGSVLTLAITRDTARLYADGAHMDQTALALLAARLELLLNAIADGVGDKTLAELPILPDTERARLLRDWNATASEFDVNLTIHAAFEAQAQRTPDATALFFEGDALTYAALNARANATAKRLQSMGVKPGSHVGLYTRRSPDLLIGALAILKAGGAYVPLDPSYPADRIAHYITDSRAQVIVTQADLEDTLPPHQAQCLILDAAPADASADNLDGGATGADLAYLIYTSGSTGTPKGVMVRHSNVSNFFAAMDTRIPHAIGDTWLAVTSLSFDISVLELFWTLARGLRVVLSSDESRLTLSNGAPTVSDRRMDFNLMYWGNDDGPGPKKYELLLEGAKFADAHGFNAVWTPERHFHAFGGPYPNPSVTGAAVAAVTQNLSVRAGSCVAPLHHPARIAEEWAVIDNLTNGRAALGIASGWQPDDFVLRPENTPPQNKPAMFETIDVLRKLWRGEAVDFPRKDGSMHTVITQPRPVSKELPLWVTTAGNPDTWREAGQIGANVLTHLLGQSIDEVAGKIRIYHEALREAGHNPDDFTVTLMLHTYLADTREQARDVAREPMKDYLRAAAGLIKQYAWAFPAFKKPKGVNNPYEMDLGILSDAELEAILDFAFERYFEDSGLFGTIDDGVRRAEDLKRIGVDEIACLIDYGIAPDVVLEGLRPLAEVLRLANAPSELAMDDHSLAAQIKRHTVTHMQCTPSMARMIAADDQARVALGHLQHLLIGGEALSGDLVAELHACTNAQIHNMYGPTETTIWSTTQTLGAAPRGIADIGKPVGNTAVYVLDETGHPVPTGAPGELYIGGAGVTAGYWQRPDLTKDRYVSDPFAQGSARMYRTGDLVRWRVDGRLAYLGRTDHQVKIRGHRIELGEIEAAMSRFAGVTSAVVLARQMAGGDERLVGYVTTNAPVSENALRAHLSATLTDIMVPSTIVTLDAMPLTPNKKIDRKALPEPQPIRKPTETTVSAPIQGTAARIGGIWAKILGLTDIRDGDNFFDLGGHSLLAVQAHREIRDDLGAVKLSITDIFRFPVLGALSAHVDKLTGGPVEPETADPQNTIDKSQTMSKRRAMRAGRRTKTG
ncbi:LLM class flavin-dependent oxidoreductase [Aliisedimentitalea scapharcae]|uniref:LLM class flavin-dependent oxidoreductase n=1 Tax=Aliisedimentitalea scapharcae TaxID=1524259 RepID=A0ABZ2XYX1_9RHOB